MVARAKETPDLAPRLALRAAEAAEALGISERLLRQVLPELPHLRIGTCLLFPVEGLEDWLRERSKGAGEAADRTAQEILEKLNE